MFNKDEKNYDHNSSSHAINEITEGKSSTGHSTGNFEYSDSKSAHLNAHNGGEENFSDPKNFHIWMRRMDQKCNENAQVGS